jgi:hypothetical protein
LKETPEDPDLHDAHHRHEPLKLDLRQNDNQGKRHAKYPDDLPVDFVGIL